MEYVLKVSTKIVPLRECTDADKKLSDLMWMDTDKSVALAHKGIDRDFAPDNARRKSKA